MKYSPSQKKRLTEVYKTEISNNIACIKVLTQMLERLKNGESSEYIIRNTKVEIENQLKFNKFRLKGLNTNDD